VPVLKVLNRASRGLADLKGQAEAIPNLGILIDTLALQEARASSAIGNIVPTQDELFQAVAQRTSSDVLLAIAELLGFLATSRFLPPRSRLMASMSAVFRPNTSNICSGMRRKVYGRRKLIVR
jgi:hypothetical protein